MAQVVLSRAEWGQIERLPPYCIHCGRVADDYVEKSPRHQTRGLEGVGPTPSGEPATLGCSLGLIKWLTVGNSLTLSGVSGGFAQAVTARHERTAGESPAGAG